MRFLLRFDSLLADRCFAVACSDNRSMQAGLQPRMYFLVRRAVPYLTPQAKHCRWLPGRAQSRQYLRSKRPKNGVPQCAQDPPVTKQTGPVSSPDRAGFRFDQWIPEKGLPLNFSACTRAAFSALHLLHRRPDLKCGASHCTQRDTQLNFPLAI